jgi:hypothetical protein
MSLPIRAYLASFAIWLIAVPACSGENDRKPPDEEFLRNYMAGEYDLIDGLCPRGVQRLRVGLDDDDLCSKTVA